MSTPDRSRSCGGSRCRQWLPGAPGHPGFSLIELLIAVATAAVLAALAYASYAAHIRKAHRAEARRVLIEAAQALERNYSAVARYDLDATGRPMATGTTPNSPPFPAHLRHVDADPRTGALYELTFAEPPTATTWALIAVRRPGSAMAADPCGNYTLDSSGRRSVTEAAADAVAERCWSRGAP